MIGASAAMSAGAARASDKTLLRDQLSLLSDLIHARDMAMLDRFTDDAFLIGSEGRDQARGREQIRAHLAEYYSAPVRLSWIWETVDGQVTGDAAWLMALGSVGLEDGKGQIERKPYRLSGALVRRDGVWRWRMFHGSQPIA